MDASREEIPQTGNPWFLPEDGEGSGESIAVPATWRRTPRRPAHGWKLLETKGQSPNSCLCSIGFPFVLILRQQTTISDDPPIASERCCLPILASHPRSRRKLTETRFWPKVCAACLCPYPRLP